MIFVFLVVHLLHPRAYDYPMPEAHDLIAYRVSTWPPLRLVPAARNRDWMDATTNRFAYRCLPLLMGNQTGWFILNSHAMRFYWTGTNHPNSISIQSLDPSGHVVASSHFGHGVITWSVPWLFKTPPGWNLLVRGPTNWCKDGATPLDGIVETDWSVATFTMNWRVTREGEPIIFQKDEPIALILPQRRGETESFNPVIRDIAADPALKAEYDKWFASRNQFLKDLPIPGTQANRETWEKHYFQGVSPHQASASDHQTKVEIKEFREEVAG